MFEGDGADGEGDVAEDGAAGCVDDADGESIFVMVGDDNGLAVGVVGHFVSAGGEAGTDIGDDGVVYKRDGFETSISVANVEIVAVGKKYETIGA